MRSKNPMSRGRLSMLLVAAVMAIFAIAGTSTAMAACSQPFNCFEGGDGNQTVDASGMTDWQTLQGVMVSKDPSKGQDSKFAGGDKETAPGAWDFITGNNTPKTDILRGWNTFDGRFLNVAFSRVKQQGDTFLAFELNQDPPGPRVSGDIPVPHRSTGDILFTYDISTTNHVSFGMCTWQGDSPDDSASGNWMWLDGQTVVGGSVKECTPLDPTTNPAAEGNVNWNNAINPNYLDDFKSIGAGQFGEAAVDFGTTQVGKDFLQGAITNACAPNGWLWMHSRASRSVVSQPKDILSGGALNSPTCSFSIDKKVALSSDSPVFVDAPVSGPLAASVGDSVTYQITVKNTGTAPLSVNLTDPLCDASALDDGAGHSGNGDVIAVGGSIVYTCKHTVSGNEGANPFENVACATANGMASNGTGTPVTTPVPGGQKCDDAWVESFPLGQLSAGRGTKYLDSDSSGTKNGDEAGIGGFVFYVDYNDNKTLDAGEPAAPSASDGTWTISGIRPGTYNVREMADPNFTCTEPLTGCSYNIHFGGGDTANVGQFGNAPAAQLAAPTEVAPGQIVLGERITPGRARLLGPTGCQARAFHARISGTKVARVVFILDGHRIKTLTRKNFRGTFAVRIDPRRLKIGVHRLVAKVTFQRGSGTKAKTFRLAFQRCPRALRAPRFTG